MNYVSLKNNIVILIKMLLKPIIVFCMLTTTYNSICNTLVQHQVKHINQYEQPYTEPQLKYHACAIAATKMNLDYLYETNQIKKKISYSKLCEKLNLNNKCITNNGINTNNIKSFLSTYLGWFSYSEIGTNINTIIKNIRINPIVMLICLQKNPDKFHWVILTGYNKANETFMILDPAKDGKTYSKTKDELKTQLINSIQITP